MTKIASLFALILFSMLFVSAQSAPSANAATLTVVNAGDTGAGSLRDTIAAAASGDTIVFDTAGVFSTPRTITLVSELVINKSLTIQGPGLGSLTVSGGNAVRVLNIAAGDFNVTLSGMTIANGRNLGANGANGADNTSSPGGNGGSVLGGGIYNASTGQLTVTNSTLSGNTASGGNGGNPGSCPGSPGWGGGGGNGGSGLGGGIYNASTGQLTVTNSTLSGNTASGGNGGDARSCPGGTGPGGSGGSGSGGGIYNESTGTVTITNSTLSGNTASGGNGGTGSASLPSPGGNGFGGGIYNLSGTATVMNSTLSGNAALGGATGGIVGSGYGGGIYNASTGMVTITNSTLSGNTASGGNSGRGGSGYGGGIYNASTGTVTITNSTFSGNTASGGNGGFGTPNPGTGPGGTGPNGGSSFGGGIYNASTGTVTITNSTLSGNTASGGTGGVGGFASSPFSNGGPGGVAGSGYGGGIYNASTGMVTITNSTLSGNTASGGTGGRGGESLSSSNNATGGLGGSGFGGGIYNFRGTATVTNSTVSGNTASGGTGGDGGTQKGGSGGDSDGGPGGNGFGGGVYNLRGTATVTNSTVSGNTASGGTGGSGGFGGGGTSGERGFGSGGGIRRLEGTVNTLNTMIAANTATAFPDVYGAFASQGYNLIGDGTGGSGFTGTGDLLGTAVSPIDPGLAPLGNYGGPTQTRALLSTSPAVDAGTSTGAPATDQRGASRVGNTDIGAFELNGTITGGTYAAVLPLANLNIPFNVLIAPNSGSFTYSVTSGSLPNGVSLTSSFARNRMSRVRSFAPSAVVALDGTPTQAGIFDFAITAASGANSNVTNYRLQILGPTAAGVSISGRVLTSDGRGLRNATVVLTDQSGATRRAVSSSFGYYRFDDVPTGETYIIGVTSKRYTFAPRVVSVTDALTELDFVASP